jgi:deazaflavin-dependent oxidoreductase (nitroreductase family)
MMNSQPAASVALPPTNTSLKSRVLRRISRGSGAPSRIMAGRRGFALWALVEATGRTTGRIYRIPVATAPTPDGFVIPLPFGGATQWARNVLATGGATIRWNGGTYTVIDPEIIPASEAKEHFIAPIRALLPSIGIHDFLRVRIG